MHSHPDAVASLVVPRTQALRELRAGECLGAPAHPSDQLERVTAVRDALREGRINPVSVAEATGVPTHVIELWAAGRIVQDSWRYRITDWAAEAGLPPLGRGREL